MTEQAQDANLPREVRDALLRAFAEAWQWAIGHVSSQPRPGQNSDADVFITRAVRDALRDGIDRLRAAERLRADLHSRLAAAVRRQFLLGEYELGAFAAVKEVEVSVREPGGYDNTMTRALAGGGHADMWYGHVALLVNLPQRRASPAGPRRPAHHKVLDGR